MSEGKPYPIAFTIKEGGEWFHWNTRTLDTQIFAIKFSDGWIFDRLVGWRRAVPSPIEKIADEIGYKGLLPAQQDPPGTFIQKHIDILIATCNFVLANTRKELGIQNHSMDPPCR